MLGADFLQAPRRQAAVVEQTAHRPWPLPEGPWLLGQTWEDLLFAHWPVPAATLRPLLPPALKLQEHSGSAWLGVTPFRVTALRLRGTLPVPGLSTFVETNVRTYVTYEGKPGIWFFSLDTPSRPAVEVARRLYRLPYFHARMELRERAGRVEYSVARGSGKAFSARVAPRARPEPVAAGSLERFLVERYCLYAAEGDTLYRAEIHHPPWLLQPVEGVVDLNTLAPNGVRLPDEAPLLHFARRQDVVLWPLERLA